MNLSQYAYRYRLVVFLMMFLAVAFGFFSYFNLPTREDPKITIREAVVSTTHSGLPAEDVERYITKPLEEQIRSVGAVKRIRSTSMRGHSIIHVEVHYRFFDLEQIWDEVRQKLTLVEGQLPEGTSGPTLNDDFGDVAVVTAALTSEDFSAAEQLDMAEHIRTELHKLEGTQRIQLLGVQPERVFIDMPEARLAELGLSPQALAAQIQAHNVQASAAVLETKEQRLALQVSGEFQSVEALGNMEIQLPGDGGTLRLRDFARVEHGYREPVQQTAYYNGERAIVLAISMLDGYSVLDYGKAVKAAIQGLREVLPAGYQLEVMTFQADQVANAVYGVTTNVLQTLLIVLAVVVMFLGLRTGMIVGSIIPVVMLMTLAVMGLIELPLERMSLATLVIALGLLVDNAIVIAEDFKTRVEQGLDRDQALAQSGGELALPLLSSSLTTVLMFLPLMMAEHEAGEYARSISIVIAVTLLSSWVLSLTVTPTLCHRYLKAGGGGNALSDRLFSFMSRRYERLLRRVLGHRGLFLAGAVGALVLGAVLMSIVPNKFFPDSDRHQVLVYLDFPSATAPSETDRVVQSVSQRLSESTELAEHVTGLSAYAGFGGPRFVLSLTPIDPAPNKGFMVLNVDSRKAVGLVIPKVRELIEREFPQVSAEVTRMFLGPSDSSVLEVQVKGPDREVLYSAATEVETLLADVPGARDVNQSWEERIAFIDIEVNQAQARRAGISSQAIARSLQGAIDGHTLSRFRGGRRTIPIVLRYEEDVRGDLDRLASLMVYPEGDRAGGVPLHQVATLNWRHGYYRIDRDNLIRNITIQARNQSLTAEDMVPRVQSELDSLERRLPEGHWIELDGVVAESAEGKAALQANLPLCLGLIFVLLVAQFNSLKRPLLIVATIPFVIVGVSLGLLVMRGHFGFMVLLGLYALAGIIINNAIVLIDRIDLDRQAPGMDGVEAIVRASVRRLRPIIMSTVTTILGFMPLILGNDPLFYNMACAMAFGLAAGTVMSLGIVPVLYSYFILDRNVSETA